MQRNGRYPLALSGAGMRNYKICEEIMREEQIFAKTLEELSALAKEQGNMLSEEQVTEAFDKAKLNLGEPQLEMIFAYLKNKKIGIGQPADPFDYMTQEEIDYLEEYLKAVQLVRT